MNHKVLLVILDGAGDRPIAELNYQTPLEAANTPFLDGLAEQSQCGMMGSIGFYRKPSSDLAHMTILGLDMVSYPGRGPIEAAGIGVKHDETDVFFRGNFCRINNEGVIVDRRAGRKNPPKMLLDEIRTTVIDDVVFNIHHIAEHRFVLQLKGDGLSSKVSDNDPHVVGVFPSVIESLDGKHESSNTANLLNRYIEILSGRLKSFQDSSINHILLRSPGTMPRWPSFYEKYGVAASCIANNALYNGIGSLLKMNVLLPNRFEDYRLYYDAIPDLLCKAFAISDFVFLHFQETDLCGEDGDWREKTRIIEKIDVTLSSIRKLLCDLCVVITSDHSTPCSLQSHSGDEVPFMIYHKGGRFDDVKAFNEKSCCNGSLGHFTGDLVMPMIQNAININKLVGG